MRILLSVGAIVAAVSVACGGSGAAAPTPSSQIATPSASASPTPEADKTFTSPVWRYTFRYPASWSEAPTGNSAQVAALSNEPITDSNTLAGLDDNGVYFTVIVQPSTAACPGPTPSGGDLQPQPVTVDGVDTVIGGFHTAQGPVATYSLKTNAAQGRYCYTFNAVTLTAQERTQVTASYMAILRSFKFGTPTSPPF